MTLGRWATLWATLALGLAGCDDGRAVDADAGADVGADAGADAGPGADAGADAGPDAGPDAGADAGPDAGADAGPDVDAGADAGTLTGTDAGTDAGTVGGAVVKYECVPPVAGNELNSGMVLSSNFWPGFRFEVPAGPDVTTGEVGVNIQSSSAGTIFAALVRLTGPSDTPDAADLTGSDVLGTTTIALPGGSSSSTELGSIPATLAPGWYAAVFGTAAFGAGLASATIHSNSGAGGCLSGYGFPFSIRQSDGMFILQGATPHMVVSGTRP